MIYKSLVFCLALTSAYCKPLISEQVPPLTENERELMENPLFPMLFREFLNEVVSLSHAQNASDHSSHLKEIIKQATTFSSPEIVVNENSNAQQHNQNIGTTTSIDNSNVEQSSESTSSQVLSTTAFQTNIIENKLETEILNSDEASQNIVPDTTTEKEETNSKQDLLNEVADISAENEKDTEEIDESSIHAYQGAYGNKIVVNNSHADVSSSSHKMEKNTLEDALEEIEDEMEENTDDDNNSNENDSMEEIESEELQPPTEETKYQFATRVDDNINGNFQQREETREGDKITGSYAYDDGNILRTVTYVADAKGFRIIKDETSSSIKATQERSNVAQVQTFHNGHKVQYNVIKDSEEED